MELLTIRESSLGAFAESFQAAIIQGYRHSQEPSRYAWSDNQYNAVLERSESLIVGIKEAVQDESEQPTKKQAGRPPRKL